MKRVILCESAYIDLTEKQYNECKTFKLKDEETEKFVREAKRIFLPKNMILLVPLTEFKDIDE